jgi:excisionase family DNA binding protein
MDGNDHSLCDLCKVGGVQLSEAMGLASEAADFLRRQERPDMADAVETLRAAALVTTEESLTPGQVAVLIGRHRNTVRNWVNRGWLRATKVGPRGDIRVLRADAERLNRLIEVSRAAGGLTRRQMEEYFAEKRAARRRRSPE